LAEVARFSSTLSAPSKIDGWRIYLILHYLWIHLIREIKPCEIKKMYVVLMKEKEMFVLGQSVKNRWHEYFMGYSMENKDPCRQMANWTNLATKWEDIL
jgi:uncharacterized protein YpbB